MPEDDEDEARLLHDFHTSFGGEARILRIDGRNLAALDGPELVASLEEIATTCARRHLTAGVRRALHHPLRRAIVDGGDWRALIPPEWITPELEALLAQWAGFVAERRALHQRRVELLQRRRARISWWYAVRVASAPMRVVRRWSNRITSAWWQRAASIVEESDRAAGTITGLPALAYREPGATAGLGVALVVASPFLLCVGMCAGESVAVLASFITAPVLLLVGVPAAAMLVLGAVRSAISCFFLGAHAWSMGGWPARFVTALRQERAFPRVSEYIAHDRRKLDVALGLSASFCAPGRFVGAFLGESAEEPPAVHLPARLSLTLGTAAFGATLCGLLAHFAGPYARMPEELAPAAGALVGALLAAVPFVLEAFGSRARAAPSVPARAPGTLTLLATFGAVAWLAWVALGRDVYYYTHRIPFNIEVTTTALSTSDLAPVRLPDVRVFDQRNKLMASPEPVRWEVSSPEAGVFESDLWFRPKRSETIRLYANVGRLRAEAVVLQVRAPTGVTIGTRFGTVVDPLVEVGETLSWLARVEAGAFGLIDTPVRWTSSNTLVAQVSEEGVVTVRGPGRAVISVSAGQAASSVTVTGTRWKLALVPRGSVRVGGSHHVVGPVYVVEAVQASEEPASQADAAAASAEGFMPTSLAGCARLIDRAAAIDGLVPTYRPAEGVVTLTGAVGELRLLRQLEWLYLAELRRWAVAAHAEWVEEGLVCRLAPTGPECLSPVDAGVSEAACRVAREAP
ncbi:MAG: hypothetical protein Q8P41_13805 [Pseudomonadota bacterium]|nr:hypothetical protein [Pseudomonadota bacterium]